MIKILNWKKTAPELKEKILKRSQLDIESINEYVKEWIDKIKKEGDKAIIEYINKFDDPDLTLKNIKVSKEEIKKAYQNVAPDVLEAIKEQIRISQAFHKKQYEHFTLEWEIETVSGVKTGMKKCPIQSACLYVPAGKAPLPTIAQILTVAASAAQVPRKVVSFAPTGPHHEIIVAAAEAGADEIYRLGGIAAIAAFALGTESIRPVNIIAGPGNPYVQSAKMQLFGQVGIDMIAGPSEMLTIADPDANPQYLAAEVLARCEHGPDSAGVIVTNSQTLAQETKAEIEKQFTKLSRQEYIKKSLDNYSAIITCDNLEEMIDFANDYSAEHLVIQTKDPRAVLAKIYNAGSVFLGRHAPVAIGDYASGTNHCIPIGVAPKFSSPVGVETFMKNIEFQELTKEGLNQLRLIINKISAIEGLDGHNYSVEIRFEK